jgi:hypothetical protein
MRKGAACDTAMMVVEKTGEVIAADKGITQRVRS